MAVLPGVPMPIVILGPTASGKSSLAAALARRMGGTIVNGDPFQALEGIPIGTGQPSPAEQAAVLHLGYGLLPLTTVMNPQFFGAQVRQWLSSAQAPLLVTGSGLYLRGIWQQLDELPEVDPGIILRVRAWGASLGAPVLHRYLRAVDPERAQALHPNDAARIQRALALHLGTGGKPSELLRGVQRSLPEGWRALLVLPTRESLRERVRLRVRAMVREGWAMEVDRAVAAGHTEDLRRLRPLGYLPWLEGGDSALIEARIVQETQAYAKRQVTWFRNQLPGLPEWDPDREDVEAAAGRVLG